VLPLGAHQIDCDGAAGINNQHSTCISLVSSDSSQPAINSQGVWISVAAAYASHHWRDSGYLQPDIKLPLQLFTQFLN
jgi:hypothetical protein